MFSGLRMSSSSVWVSRFFRAQVRRRCGCAGWSSRRTGFGGLLKGVLIGAILSLVLLIRRVSSPHVAFLSRIPGARRYSDLKRHPDNEPTPGVLAFRVESSIVYFNAEHVFDTVLSRVDATREPIRLVICDLSTSPARGCS